VCFLALLLPWGYDMFDDEKECDYKDCLCGPPMIDMWSQA